MASASAGGGAVTHTGGNPPTEVASQIPFQVIIILFV